MLAALDGPCSEFLLFDGICHGYIHVKSAYVFYPTFSWPTVRLPDFTHSGGKKIEGKLRNLTTVAEVNFIRSKCVAAHVNTIH